MQYKIKTFLFILAGTLLPVAQTLAQTASSPAINQLNPLGNTSEGAPEIYGRILKFLLGFTGVAALVFFVIGGIMILMSRGNPEKVKGGKDTIVWAIIGLFIAFSSYIILRYVLEVIVTQA